MWFPPESPDSKFRKGANAAIAGSCAWRLRLELRIEKIDGAVRSRVWVVVPFFVVVAILFRSLDSGCFSWGERGFIV